MLSVNNKEIPFGVCGNQSVVKQPQVHQMSLWALSDSVFLLNQMSVFFSSGLATVECSDLSFMTYKTVGDGSSNQKKVHCGDEGMDTVSLLIQGGMDPGFHLVYTRF